MARRTVLCSLVGLLILAGCASGAKVASTDSRSLQAAARAWERALADRDAERVASFYGDDVVAFYPHPRPTIGWEANRAAWIRVFQSPTKTHPVRIDEVVTSPSGDLGYTVGTWWSTDPAALQDSGGRFLAVWRRIDGEWKITRLSANRHDDVKADSAPKP